MKRILTCGLVLLLLAGCGKKAEKPLVYTTDAKIDFIYHENTDAHLITYSLENTGTTVINDITILVIGYDESGAIVNSSQPVKSVSLSNLGLEAGQAKAFRIDGTQDDTSVYFRTLISAITFATGSTWTISSQDSWLSQQALSVDVDIEKKAMVDAATAASNLAAQISTVSFEQERMTVSDGGVNQGLAMKITNNADASIQSISFLVAMRADDGSIYAVSADRQFFAKNIRVVNNQNVIAPHTTSIELSTDHIFTDAIANYDIIVWEITYDNGSTWLNTNALGWAYLNQ